MFLIEFSLNLSKIRSMKKHLLFTLGILALIPVVANSQSTTAPDSSASFVFTSQCISMTLTPELRSLENSVAYQSKNS